MNASNIPLLWPSLFKIFPPLSQNFLSEVETRFIKTSSYMKRDYIEPLLEDFFTDYQGYLIQQLLFVTSEKWTLFLINCLNNLACLNNHGVNDRKMKKQRVVNKEVQGV